jgi:stage II sporulation protein D
VLKARRVTVTNRQSQATEFELAVPGKIRRRYRGMLEVRVVGAVLMPVVTMGLEDAVAAVVAAESSPDAPLEALKAQAVAARSYFAAAGGRHRDFDFCDTTHCQFLREIPVAGSEARRATDATRGLVLAYEARPFAAMYTRSCSGRTHTPTEVKLPAGVYPYYPVECAYCQAHPQRWQSKISEHDALLLHSSDELSRLKLTRRLGWSTVLSNDFISKKDGEFVRLEGVGQGHGIGLCQAGAKAMAQAGADFRRILAHYYPNAAVEQL